MKQTIVGFLWGVTIVYFGGIVIVFFGGFFIAGLTVLFIDPFYPTGLWEWWMGQMTQDNPVWLPLTRQILVFLSILGGIVAAWIVRKEQ